MGIHGALGQLFHNAPHLVPMSPYASGYDTLKIIFNINSIIDAIPESVLKSSNLIAKFIDAIYAPISPLLMVQLSKIIISFLVFKVLIHFKI